MNQIVVFDFDKTLTYKDSLSTIFKSSMTGVKWIFRPFYFFLQCCSKFGIISAKYEKELMFKLVYNSNYELFIRHYKDVKSKIDVTPIFEILIKYVSDGWTVIVLSASEQSFLEYFFSDIKGLCIIGSTLQTSGNRIVRINRHPSGTDKRKALNILGVKLIDECYFDSKSDECLLPISRKSFKVKNGKIVKILHN